MLKKKKEMPTVLFLLTRPSMWIVNASHLYLFERSGLGVEGCSGHEDGDSLETAVEMLFGVFKQVVTRRGRVRGQSRAAQRRA